MGGCQQGWHSSSSSQEGSSLHLLPWNYCWSCSVGMIKCQVPGLLSVS